MFWILALLAAAAGASQPVHFEKRVLADDLAGGYQVVSCDVNGDGKLDLIALASDMSDLVWFENPTWERHVLARHLPHMINLACWNRAPNAPPVIAIAYEFSMHPEESAGIVALLTPGKDPLEPWNATEIDRLPASHRLRWADVDGSGNKLLINAPLAATDARAPDYRGHVPLVYYRPGEWKRRIIGNAEQGVMHGICITDWDHNGKDAILIGSFLGIHLYRFQPNGTWSRTEIAKGSPQPWPKSGTSDIAVGLLGKERFLAAIEPWHGNQVVVYRRNGSLSQARTTAPSTCALAWKREVIDDTLSDSHTIETVDLDGDGRDEIIAGFRGKPYGVYIYRFDGEKWNRTILDQGGISAAGCAITDLNEDGRPEIACIGQATHNLILWRIASRFHP